MLIELHCPCGLRQPLSPEKVPAKVRCSACKKVLQFAQSGQAKDETLWLAVGGQTGEPRLAVPMPIGLPLTLGRSPKCWLSVPGDEIEDLQAEITVGDGGRVEVKHLAGDSGTWINRARIATGVLWENDKLRIGPFVMRLLAHNAVLAATQAALEPDVVVEIETDEAPPAESRGARKKRAPVEAADEDFDFRDEQAPASDAREDLIDYREGWSGGQKIRLIVCIVLILAASGYLAKAFFFPAVSEEMPDQTVFYCRVDGTAGQGDWPASAGAPICPNCGQRCLGELKYKAEVIAQPPKTPPTADAATVSQPAEAADGQKTVAAKDDDSKKRTPPKKKKKKSSRKGASKGGSK